MWHLTSNPKVVSAFARIDCEVLEISDNALREILNQDPQLSDLILQALIARRQLMRETGDFVGLRDWFALLARYFPDPRFSGEESRPFYLAGSGR